MDELDPINRQRIGPILWREKYVILVSIVVMIALAALYTVSTAKVYQASAVLQVDLPTAAPGSQDTTSADQGLAQNYATLLVSPGLLAQIRPHVDGGQLSVDSLQSRLNASALAMSALVELHVTGPSPQSAQTIARQVIAGFLANLQNDATTRTAQLQSQLQRSITSLSAQISTLQASAASAAKSEQVNALKASRQALISQDSTLVANGLAEGTSVTLSAPPVASASPISPKKSLNLMAGLVLGILLGVALAWARSRLRPAIHSADDVAALVDVPLLASIPLKPRLKADDPSLSEAYGVLHANLNFALRSGDMRVVTFVGYNAQVGKTSTVEGLARAAGRGERRVLIVDGDMRAASLSARFGYRNHPGLVDLLQDAIPVDAALVPVEGGLWLLPSRPSRLNAASLLAGGRTYTLFAELRERFDLVLIDSPPLAGLADGLILASQSDAVVLVVRAGVTKPADVTAATNSLLHNMAPIAGVVVFEDLPVESYYPIESERTRAPSATVAP